MKLYMDLHTHTMACGHGFSTLKENIEAAQEAGLSFLGLSEHAPAMPGGSHPFFFSNYKCIPRQYGKLRLLCGVEANIVDYEGRLDMEEGLLAKMDYVIASMHVVCVTPGSRRENTRASIKAMLNPYVKILGHPDDSRYPLDYDELARAARSGQAVLELNNSSLNPQNSRQGGRENIRTLLSACEKYDVPIIMGTDSHICYAVGQFADSLDLIKEMDFPQELILNADPGNIGRLVNVAI